MRSTASTTSLWAVIEGMQMRLEAEGLETEVVDAAIARGVEALLRTRPGSERASILYPNAAAIKA